MRTDRLNDLIKESSLTKFQIADQSGISRTTLDNVLAGADAKISTIETLAKVLGTRVSYLFGEDEIQDREKEIDEYKKEIERLSSLMNKKPRKAKVIVELDVDDEEFVKLGLEDRLIQVLNKEK